MPGCCHAELGNARLSTVQRCVVTTGVFSSVPCELPRYWMLSHLTYKDKLHAACWRPAFSKGSECRQRGAQKHFEQVGTQAAARVTCRVWWPLLCYACQGHAFVFLTAGCCKLVAALFSFSEIARLNLWLLINVPATLDWNNKGV